MKSVCVYCGASFNGDQELALAVEDLAKVLTSEAIDLVYGGGSVGVMGLVADAVMNRGGKVTGVIPQFLLDLEVAHREVTQLIVTENMHQRKKNMADLSDGFIILPGGFGTLEEFFEVLTWLQLGLHNKPIGVLNVGGYYDSLFQQLDVMVERGFLKLENRELVINEKTPEELLRKMKAFHVQPDGTWLKERNLT
ncbi:MAG: TIGR00730 family Rossman fold protein [Arcticibacter sp.]